MRRKEPAITTAVIASIAGALLALLLSFGLPLTDDQIQAIQGLVIVVSPLVVGIVTRHIVYSPDTVAKERRERHGH